MKLLNMLYLSRSDMLSESETGKFCSYGYKMISREPYKQRRNKNIFCMDQGPSGSRFQ